MKKHLLPICLFLLSAVPAVSSAETQSVPRPEYPRPQFQREQWVNLNGGDWTYRFDFGRSGRGQSLHSAGNLGHLHLGPELDKVH